MNPSMITAAAAAGHFRRLVAGLDVPVAVQDTFESYAGAPSIQIDPRTNDSDPVGGGLTIIDASVVSGGGGVNFNAAELTITLPTSEGEQVISYTVQDVNGGTAVGQVVGTIYPELVATGLEVLNATEGTPPNDWYGFTFIDPEEEDDDITGIFEGGKNQTLVKDSGDVRITVVDNRPAIDFTQENSESGFEATAIFSAVDEFGQAAGPVEISFKVVEVLEVEVEGEVGRIRTEGPGAVNAAYDGPGTLYDSTNALDPALVIDLPPRPWSSTTGPKISDGVGYPGLWYNDETTGGEMSLTYEWRDDSANVIDSGTWTPETNWAAPMGATVLRIIATDANGSTIRESGEAVNEWVLNDNGDGTFTIIATTTPDPSLTITDNGDGSFDVAA